MEVVRQLCLLSLLYFVPAEMYVCLLKMLEATGVVAPKLQKVTDVNLVYLIKLALMHDKDSTSHILAKVLSMFTYSSHVLCCSSWRWPCFDGQGYGCSGVSAAEGC